MTHYDPLDYGKSGLYSQSSVIIFSIFFAGDEELEEYESQWIKCIIENRRMNKVRFNERKNPIEDFLHYWFLQRNPLHLQLPASGVHDIVQSFLTSDAKCVPGFTFIMYRPEIKHIIRNIDFISPALLIDQGFRAPEETRPFHDSESDIITADTRNKYSHLRLRFQEVDSYFDGFHVNRDISGLKIIVTDWSDPMSPKPNVDDPEFPIGSVLYLETQDRGYELDTLEIQNFLRKCRAPFSDAILYADNLDDRFSGPKIFSIDGKGSKIKSTSQITVTFAGKNVKSAVHNIMLERGRTFEEELEEFKRNLEFEVDDDRVIGFLFNHWLNDLISYLHLSHAIASTISKIFPSIRLTKFKKTYFSRFKDESTEPPRMILHLVRF